MTSKSVVIKVRGSVQGVGFRAATLKEAKSLNLCGIVRNEPDKSVYIEASGEYEQIERFVDWCHHGPIYASVEEIEIIEQDLAQYTDFTIT